MSAVEIVVIIAAVAIVASVFTAWLVRKLKGKPSGCSGCAGCPYAGSCHSAASNNDNKCYCRRETLSTTDISDAVET